MNLLPLAEKRLIRREYYKRLTVVSLSLLAILIVIAVVPLVVAYITSNYEIMSLERELELFSKKNSTEGISADLGVIKDINSRLNILSSNYKKILGQDLSVIFSSIVDKGKLQKLRLTSFVYDKVSLKKGQTKTVAQRMVFGGTASDRDSLGRFVKELSIDKRFASVDLPISNLIESKNINFFITVMMSKE